MSDAGKYRWMRVREVLAELDNGEYVWVCHRGEMYPGLYAHGVVASPTGTWTIDPPVEIGLRICRAMVPLPPE